MSNNIYINTNGADQQNMGLLEGNTQDLEYYEYISRLRSEICNINGKAKHKIRSSWYSGQISVRERELDIQIIYVSSEDDQLNNIITLSKTELPKLISILQSI
jgi:hypothetical protein